MLNVLDRVVLAGTIGPARIIVYILDIVSWVREEVVKESLISTKEESSGSSAIAIAIFIVINLIVRMVTKVEAIFSTVFALNSAFIVIRLPSLSVLPDLQLVKVQWQVIELWIEVGLSHRRHKGWDNLFA